MALSDFLEQLDALVEQAQRAFSIAADAEALEAARVEFLGAKSGRLKATQRQMGSVESAERPAAGKRLNEVKLAIDTAFQQAKERLGASGRRTPRPAASDPSLPGTAQPPLNAMAAREPACWAAITARQGLMAIHPNGRPPWPA